MPDSAETLNFVRDSFRSVWSLELLCILKSDPSRAWPRAELVERLRASDSVVEQSVEGLVAGGLVVVEEDGSARYAPASPELDRLSRNAEELYAKRPGAVRRLIVMSGSSGSLTAFAEAFRLRGD